MDRRKACRIAEKYLSAVQERHVQSLQRAAAAIEMAEDLHQILGHLHVALDILRDYGHLCPREEVLEFLLELDEVQLEQGVLRFPLPDLVLEDRGYEETFHGLALVLCLEYLYTTVHGPMWKSGHVHPHVSTDGVPCTGDYNTWYFLANGYLEQWYKILLGVLSSYNPKSPYERLHELVQCNSCGDHVEIDSMVDCACGAVVCKDCVSRCPRCRRYVCLDCLSTCTGCKQDVCRSCMTRCHSCDHQVCDSCTDCMTSCDECGHDFCRDCAYSCSGCGATLCKDCLCQCELAETQYRTGLP